MKKIFAITILVVGILFLSATAMPVSAGVEPSPFKSDPIINRITVARYQMEIVGRTIDRFDLDANDRNIRGMYHSIRHLATKRGTSSLRSLESARGMYEQRRDDEPYDYLEWLEEFRKYNEALRDEVLDLEDDPNLPKILKEPLREIENLLDEMIRLIDDFIRSIIGQNIDL
jgi:hypothetical protein